MGVPRETTETYLPLYTESHETITLRHTHQKEKG